MRLFLTLLLLIGASAAAKADAPPALIQGALAPDAFRAAIASPDQAYDTRDPRWGMVADYGTIIGPVSSNAGSNTIWLNSYIGTINISASSSTMQLWSGYRYLFSPVAASGGTFGTNSIEIGKCYELVVPTGATAGTYTGTITGWTNNQTVTLSNVPAGGVATSVTGVRFSWAPCNALPTASLKVGQSVIVPGIRATSGTGSFNVVMSTITSLTGGFGVTLAASGSSIGTLQASYETVRYGTDNSTAGNALVAAAIARGDQYLQVNGDYYWPFVDGRVANLIRIGTGSIHQNPAFTDDNTYPLMDLPVARARSPAPLTFENRIVAGSLPAAAYSRPIKIAGIGDSIGNDFGINPIAPFRNTARKIEMEIIAQRGKRFADSFYDMSGVGATWAQICNNTPAGYPGWWLAIDPNTPHKAWLGTDSTPGILHDYQPDIVMLEGADNSGVATLTTDLTCIVNTMQAWTKAPSIIGFGHWPWNQADFTAPGWSPFDSTGYWNGMGAGYFGLKGLTWIDMAPTVTLATLGVDPSKPPLRMRQDVPASYAGEYIHTPPWVAPFQVRDWASGLVVVDGVSLNNMWSGYGGELQFRIGSTKQDSGNVFRLGKDTATGMLYYQIDGSNGTTWVPKTLTSYDMAGRGAINTKFFMYVQFWGPTCNVAIQSVNTGTPANSDADVTKVYDGPCPRQRARFQPAVTSTSGGGDGLQVAGTTVYGETTFVSDLTPAEGGYLSQWADWAMSGWQQNLPYYNSLGYYSPGPFGGGGLHHPSTLIMSVLDKLIDAQLFVTAGAGLPSVRTVTAAATLQTGDVNLEVNNQTVSGITITLPSLPQIGYYRVKDVAGNAATQNITLSAPTGLIDGASTYVINKSRTAIALFWNGTNWSVH